MRVGRALGESWIMANWGRWQLICAPGGVGGSPAGLVSCQMVTLARVRWLSEPPSWHVTASRNRRMVPANGCRLPIGHRAGACRKCRFRKRRGRAGPAMVHTGQFHTARCENHLVSTVHRTKFVQAGRHIAGRGPSGSLWHRRVPGLGAYAALCEFSPLKCNSLHRRGSPTPCGLPAARRLA